MHRFLTSAAAITAIAAAIIAVPTVMQAQPYYGGGMMGAGYGMMGPGYGYGMMGPGYGYGMMGPGMMQGWAGGYGPGMMGGWGGMGPGMMGYGPGYNDGDRKITTDQVKIYLQQMIRNPNLTVGEVKEKDADAITADIVTKQGNQLVQRLDFNRHNGFVQPEQ